MARLFSFMVLMVFAKLAVSQGNILRHEFFITPQTHMLYTQLQLDSPHGIINQLDTTDSIVIKSAMELSQPNTLDSLFVTFSLGIDTTQVFDTKFKIPSSGTLQHSGITVSRSGNWLSIDFGLTPCKPPFEVKALIKRVDNSWTQQHIYYYD